MTPFAKRYDEAVEKLLGRLRQELPAQIVEEYARMLVNMLMDRAQAWSVGSREERRMLAAIDKRLLVAADTVQEKLGVDVQAMLEGEPHRAAL